MVSASWSAPTPAPWAGRSNASTMYQPQELAPVEAPLASVGTVDAHVGVPVLEHPLVPTTVGPTELVVAVHDAARVVGVVEVDDVVAHEVHRHLGFAQRLHEPRAQRVAAVFLATDAHVGDEERHHHVHVARVERERVAHRELLDLGQRLQSVEPFVGGHGLPGSQT